MRLYSFEKLDVWKLGRKLTKIIYKISKEFPEGEKFGLTSQIRRAAISVTSNIAEGSARISGVEQARFTEISFGSLMEILNQLLAACDLEYIDEGVVNIHRPLIEEIGNKINKLRQVQLNRAKNKQL